MNHSYTLAANPSADNLTSDHTVTTLDASEIKSLLKTSWEKEKMLVPAFSPFPRMFSTPWNANSKF